MHARWGQLHDGMRQLAVERVFAQTAHHNSNLGLAHNMHSLGSDGVSDLAIMKLANPFACVGTRRQPLSARTPIRHNASCFAPPCLSFE